MVDSVRRLVLLFVLLLAVPVWGATVDKTGAPAATNLAVWSSARAITGNGKLVWNDTTNVLSVGNGTTLTATYSGGSYRFNGTTSGTVTLGVAAAAGTYTLLLPTTLGAAGAPLLSGGVGNPATWGAVGGAGTVASGASTQLAYYAATGSTVSGATQVTWNNGTRTMTLGSASGSGGGSRSFAPGNSTNYLSAPIDAGYEVDLSVRGFTLGAWVKISDLASNQIILVVPTVSVNMVYQLFYRAADSKICLFSNLLNSGSSFCSTATFADGSWHHVAVTLSGSPTATTIFYKDGTADASGSVAVGGSGYLGAMGQVLTLGADLLGPQSSTGLKLAYVGIWMSTLTGANITSLQTTLSPELVDVVNVKSLWKMDTTSLTDSGTLSHALTEATTGTEAFSAADNPIVTSPGTLQAGTLGIVTAPVRVTTSLGIPSSLANGDWWVDRVVTTCNLKVRANGTTYTLATVSCP